ncbi:putative glutaminyl cyclase [Xylona heveae TC161]|uniref:Peptide hydrolase n=1 Tax=Xylona heveae (strain CBS 132557 / TC161) TaxID=1328760 RepID=A0A165JHF9_XYLHT|nr:putative glutaminyl cyclase [Xylona heveae TC161]KZF26247.1 putative glutaminyl cyclase [Xylona heveae TC161]
MSLLRARSVLHFLPILLLLSALSLFSPTSAYTKLSDETLRNLPNAGQDFDIHKGKLLAPILRPRVPGTPGSTAVLNHFVDFFRTSLPNWHLEFQNSTSRTPATGNAQIPFVNLIVTRDPPWASSGDVGRLTLVAHYDSKREPAGFIGATDSAAPCAMLMHMARSIDDALTRKWAAMEADGTAGMGLEADQGVQILFLDGEEAFVTWTASDSLYGARSLASTWESSMHPALSTYHNKLSSISLFVLLDLLGAKNPTVPSHYKITHWAYVHMSEAESRLRELRLLKSSPNHPSKRSLSTRNSKARHEVVRSEPHFLPDGDHNKQTNFNGERIADDHVPFLQRGVDVLHLIPIPFPLVWHLKEDDGEHLDLDTVEDWAKIVTAFVAEWMELEGFMPESGSANKDTGKSIFQPRSKTEL